MMWFWIGALGSGLIVATACAGSSLTAEFTARRWTVEDGLPEPAITGLQQADDGYLLVATTHHLLRFDGVRWVKQFGQLPPAPSAQPAALPPGITPAMVTCAATLGDGDLWVGTARSLHRRHDNTWADWTARDGIFPWDVRCVALDREGNVWVGTSGGLVRLRQRLVQVWRSGLPLANESVTAAWAESPTNWWVGVAGAGLLRGRPGALAHEPGLPAGATVSALWRGRDGRLWIGTQGDGLWCRQPDGRLQELPEPARGISGLVEDRQGRLWVGTWSGLRPAAVAGTEPVQALAEDNAGRLWVGYGRDGLACVLPTGEVRSFREADGLPPGAVLSLHADATGTLWIGTTGGLGRWRGENDRRVFTTRNGLLDSPIVQLLTDAAGDLWHGTRRGIMRVRPAEFDAIVAGRKAVVAARVLGTEAGMADAECVGGFGARAVATADGRLWFPTVDGLAVVDPQQVGPPVAPPPVYVEDARVARRGAEFRFTAPVFAVPERAHFKWRLEGYDPGWNRATTERVAVYPRLPAGQYRFQVMARDRDSEWSAPTAPVTITVPPVVWETFGFRLAVIFGGLGLLGAGLRGYYRREAARAMRELERRHAIERERARIARDIHDDIGAGLTEVAMLSELAQDEPAAPGELREQLDGIFRRAHDLARSLNEIVWAINPAHDTLESFLSYVGEFAQDFLSAAGLACRLDLPVNPPAVAMSTAVRHQLCLALKEVLHNTVKHAGATEVHLAVTVQDRALTITVQDNGRGFDLTSSAVAGQDGLRNLRNRLADVGGRFEQTSAPGQGTRTVLAVELPAN